MRTKLLLVLFTYATIVECIIPLNILYSIINQFKLINVLIQKNCFAISAKMELLKLFSDYGVLIRLNEKLTHPQHPFIRCTENIKTVSLNKPIKTQIVVISQIEKENDLNEFDISVGEEVYFLDKNTFKIYEAYVVNNVHVTRYLGQFKEINKSSALFSPSDDFIDSFVERRNDFHGIQLIGMTEKWLSYIKIPDEFADQSNYFPENETYDVTNIVSGSYIDALKHLEKSLNFSTKLYKRKDGLWGMPKIFSNGTIILNGMMKSIVESHVDIICAAMGILPIRHTYVDFLVPMSQEVAALFITNNKKFAITDWTVYLTPFSIKLWLIIVASAITFMIIIIILERQYNEEMVSCNFSTKQLFIIQLL